MYLNKAIIVGNLTRDPELKALPNGTQVSSFSVATNNVWRDRDGNKQEDVQFHNVIVFGKQAENSAQYLKKGQQVLVEGRIQTRSWDDAKSGEKRYRTEIVADRVQFGASLNGKSGGSGDVPAGEAEIDADTREPVTKGRIAPKAKVEKTYDYPTEDINTEDIPF